MRAAAFCSETEMFVAVEKVTVEGLERSYNMKDKLQAREMSDEGGTKRRWSSDTSHETEGKEPVRQWQEIMEQIISA